jgi:DNA polymerase I-like protein with 3'-5' exonuclease and polymerase domains
MRERYQMRSIMGIYDECTATVPLELAKEYILELAEVMRVKAPGFEVAMEVDASIGMTWGDQVEIGLPTEQNIDSALLLLKSKTGS